MLQSLARSSLILMVISFSCFSLFAQERNVSGLVFDQENHEPLPNVTVSIKGSTKSTTTNDKGQFLIPVAGNEAVLKISYTGYSYQEVPVGAKSSVSVSMAKDNKKLDEVIVVGYG